MEVKLWVMGCFAAGVLTILWWGLRAGINKVYDILVRINESIIRLEETNKSMTAKQKEHNDRLNDHSERLRELERRQASCRNYKGQE